jgi:hypothetical protein
LFQQINHKLKLTGDRIELFGMKDFDSLGGVDGEEVVLLDFRDQNLKEERD